jgi:hypothetical protein
MNLNRRIRTLLYDDQLFTDFEIDLLHTPALQRLYDLHQVGYTDRVFVALSSMSLIPSAPFAADPLLPCERILWQSEGRRECVSEGVVLDSDDESNLVGIDIDHASRKLDLRELVTSHISLGGKSVAFTSIDDALRLITENRINE